MSIQAVAWAIETRVGDPTLKCLLIAIANYANDDWVAWPNQNTLSFDTEISKRTVQRALEKLVKAGLIEVTMRRRSDGSQASSLIRLLRTSVDAGGQNVTLPAGGHSSVVGGVDIAVSPPHATKVSTPNEPSINHQIEPRDRKRADADRFFDEKFWPNYPKRFGRNPKEPARQALLSAVVGGENPEDILEGLRRLVRTMRDTQRIGTQFVPTALVWIRGRGWKDDPVEPENRQRDRGSRPAQKSFFGAVLDIGRRDDDQGPDDDRGGGDPGPHSRG